MNRGKGVSFFTVILVLCGIFAAIYLIKGLLILLILPFLFTYLLNPFVNTMERRGLSRGVATLLIFLSIAVILTIGIVLLAKPATEQVQDLRDKKEIYKSKIDTWIKQAETKLGLAEEKSSERQSRFGRSGRNPGATTVDRWMGKAKRVLPGVFFGVIGTVASLLTIVPLITFFLLRDGREIRKNIITLVPNRHFERTLILQYEISRQIGRYLRGELTRSCIVGTLITAGLWIVGGPYPILLGLFAAATNVIPFVGPYIGAAPALLIVLFSGAGAEESNLLMTAGPVALVYIISQLLDMMVINPTVLGKSVKLHPLVIILSLLVGVEFLGIIGMVLAIPSASILKVVFVQLQQTRRQVDVSVSS